MLLAEDRRPLLDVELQDVARGQTEAEADGDDAAGRRAGDEVEVPADGMFEMLFDPGEECGRKHAADAAAVEREDAEELVVRDSVMPPIRSAAPCSRRGCIPPPFQSSDSSHSSK